MRKELYIYFLGLTLFLVGCKKEKLPVLPTGNSPVYQLSGKVNGQDKSFVIGDEGMAMHHGVSNENGLVAYFGEIESVATNERIRIEFVQQEIPIVGGEIKVLSGVDIPFLVHESAVKEFDFGGFGNQINNMMLQNDAGEFELTSSIELNEFGIFPTQIKFPNYSEEPFKFELNHGYRGGYLNASFESYMNGENIVLSPLYSNAVRHEWFINDELKSIESIFTGTFESGVHEVKHVVYDAYDNQAKFATIISVKGGKLFWQMKTKYAEDAAFVDQNFGRVKVSYFKNEEWFYSEKAISNMNEFFHAENVLPIKSLENEDKTQLVKFDLNFNANLVNEDHTDSLFLSSFNGTFSVGLY